MVIFLCFRKAANDIQIIHWKRKLIQKQKNVLISYAAESRGEKKKESIFANLWRILISSPGVKYCIWMGSHAKVTCHFDFLLISDSPDTLFATIDRKSIAGR